MESAEGLEHKRRQTLVSIELVIAADWTTGKSKGNPGSMAAPQGRTRSTGPALRCRFSTTDAKTATPTSMIWPAAHGAEAVQEDIAAAVEPDVVDGKNVACSSLIPLCSPPGSRSSPHCCSAISPVTKNRRLN